MTAKAIGRVMGVSHHIGGHWCWYLWRLQVNRIGESTCHNMIEVAWVGGRYIWFAVRGRLLLPSFGRELRVGAAAPDVSTQGTEDGHGN